MVLVMTSVASAHNGLAERLTRYSHCKHDAEHHRHNLPKPVIGYTAPPVSILRQWYGADTLDGPGPKIGSAAQVGRLTIPCSPPEE